MSCSPPFPPTTPPPGVRSGDNLHRSNSFSIPPTFSPPTVPSGDDRLRDVQEAFLRGDYREFTCSNASITVTRLGEPRTFDSVDANKGIPSDSLASFILTIRMIAGILFNGTDK